MPPKPKELLMRVAHLGLARLVRHAVEVALGVGVVVVDGGREDLVAQRERGDPGLEPARGAEQVPGHGLRGAQGQPPRVLAEDGLGRDRLHRVARAASTCRGR